MMRYMPHKMKLGSCQFAAIETETGNLGRINGVSAKKLLVVGGVYYKQST